MDHEQQISHRLVAEGNRLLNDSGRIADFTGIPGPDRLLNDLERCPHAFVIGSIMDRQIKAERAWIIPHELKIRLGSFEFSDLKALSEEQVYVLMNNPRPPHRFKGTMSKNLHAAIRLIDERYSGNAANIWAGRPASATVIKRFLEFKGVGQKISTMATNILVRWMRVPISDYPAIDVSADVQVRRVMVRLGLVSYDPTLDEVIERARAMNPEFPGVEIWSNPVDE